MNETTAKAAPIWVPEAVTGMQLGLLIVMPIFMSHEMYAGHAISAACAALTTLIAGAGFFMGVANFVSRYLS